MAKEQHATAVEHHENGASVTAPPRSATAGANARRGARNRARPGAVARPRERSETAHDESPRAGSRQRSGRGFGSGPSPLRFRGLYRLVNVIRFC